MSLIIDPGPIAKGSGPLHQETPDETQQRETTEPTEEETTGGQNDADTFDDIDVDELESLIDQVFGVDEKAARKWSKPLEELEEQAWNDAVNVVKANPN